MIELLRRAADRDPHAIAMIADGGVWSYGRLAAESEALAHGLRAAGIERFAIVSNDIPMVVALLAAASLVGSEACVYAPDIAAEEMDKQVTAFGHPVVISRPHRSRRARGHGGGAGRHCARTARHSMCSRSSGR